jgi:superfamily II DNA or RNA helicase
MKKKCEQEKKEQPQQQQQQQQNTLIKAYLGYQGYSIFKDTLSVDEQHALRKELMVHAHIPKSPVQPAPFPVYRESLLKLYVPRYFGMDCYGSNIENKIVPGHTIALKFAGELRDYQNVIVDKYLKAATSETCGGGGLLDVDPGKGKTVMALKIIERLAVKALVVVHKSFLTNQWKERIEQFLPGARVGTIQGQVFDIENKDIVIGMVQSLSMKEYPQNAFESFGLTVFDECFPYDTCLHTSSGIQPIGKLWELWELWIKSGRVDDCLPDILSFNRNTERFEYKKLTHAWKKMRGELVKIAALERVIRCTPEHKILTVHKGYVEASALKCGDLLLCKYDKNCKNCNDKYKNIAPGLNDDQLQMVYGSYFGNGLFHKMGLKRYRIKWFHRNNMDNPIQCQSEWNYFRWKIDMFGIQVMRFEDERDVIYIETTVFDLDSGIDLNCGTYKNEKCAEILEKMDERGLAVWFMDSAIVKKKKNGDLDCVHFHTHYFDYESHAKMATAFATKFDLDCTIERCESGFQLTLDKDNSLKLMEKIKKYIHEELHYKLDSYNESHNEKYIWNNAFQKWGTIPVTSIEKENNECPYNSVYDIEVEDNHNFVIANSPSCSDNGGIVVSNCHHMGAEVFSRCMMKLMTTYTLGLSGTMQRKDGLSKVFKMFLGDVIHKEKAESEHCVLVKGIKYIVNDDEFNEVEYDYRGNPKFSTMISKLCNYNRRSEFIVEVVIKELHHNPEQQIMILAHNKTLIQYLFKAIEHKKVATVGYYLGGMKEAELKASESKKVIIATYAMASEGLDIKTLTTLIMATPKTDVCQSVGRILRAKHTTPVVIDIIDAHDLFINQWQKRKVYYKKQNYKIVVTENGLYCSDEKNGCWLTAYIPKPNKSIQSVEKCHDDDDDDDDGGGTLTNVVNKKQPILNGTCFL